MLGHQEGDAAPDELLVGQESAVALDGELLAWTQHRLFEGDHVVAVRREVDFEFRDLVLDAALLNVQRADPEFALLPLALHDLL